MSVGSFKSHFDCVNSSSIRSEFIFSSFFSNFNMFFWYLISSLLFLFHPIDPMIFQLDKLVFDAPWQTWITEYSDLNCQSRLFNAGASRWCPNYQAVGGGWDRTCFTGLANAVGLWNVIPLDAKKFATVIGPEIKQVNIRANGVCTVIGSQQPCSVRNNANCGFLWVGIAGHGETYTFIQNDSTLVEAGAGGIFKLERA
jgi:hypothetical protein